MQQLFPGQTITTVAAGTDDNGYPCVLIATADGDIMVLTADGYNVDPEFKVARVRLEIEENTDAQV